MKRSGKEWLLRIAVLTETDDGEQYIPVRPVSPVSTLGAGDSFDAMFLNCIAAGEEMKDAVRMASDYAGDYISRPSEY